MKKQSKYKTFERIIRNLLSVPHADIKAKLDAEKRRKKKKRKRKEKR